MHIDDRYGKEGFILPPPLNGDWRDVPADLAFILASRLGETGLVQEANWRVEAMRVLALPFYPGCHLCDIQILTARARKIMPKALLESLGATQDDAEEYDLDNLGEDEAGPPQQSLRSFLYGPDGFTPLSGVSVAIHDHNARPGIVLDTPEIMQAYLEFFCFFVRAENGPFACQLDASALVHKDTGVAVSEEAVLPPLFAVSADASDAGHFSVTILYGDSLFRSEMCIDRKSVV